MEWVEEIEQIAYEQEQKPQFGEVKPFPWETVQSRLRALFGDDSLTLSHTVKGWISQEKVAEVPDSTTVPITLKPIETPVYLTIGTHDLQELATVTLGGEGAAAPFLGSSFVEGFSRYMLVEMLEELAKSGYTEHFSPALGKPLDKIPQSVAYFQLDITMRLGERTFAFCLLIPDLFRLSWKRYLATLPTPPFPEKWMRTLPLDVALEVGNVGFSLEEWQDVERGDFLVLDRCTFDPTTHKGRIVLKLGETPFFRGKWSEKGIKLFEYPRYEEVREPMEDEEDVYEEKEEETIEEMIEAEFSPEEEQPAITPENLPVQVTVELARIRMTADEVMKLSAGNLLELPVRPEQGVTLVVNGKRVGKGELLKVGEALGVRITSL